jgi:acyl dehydratase
LTNSKSYGKLKSNDKFSSPVFPGASLSFAATLATLAALGRLAFFVFLVNQDVAKIKRRSKYERDAI